MVEIPVEPELVSSEAEPEPEPEPEEIPEVGKKIVVNFSRQPLVFDHPAKSNLWRPKDSFRNFRHMRMKNDFVSF